MEPAAISGDPLTCGPPIATIEIHGVDELAIDFAIAMPGTTDCKHYTGGTVHRVR